LESLCQLYRCVAEERVFKPVADKVKQVVIAVGNQVWIHSCSAIAKALLIDFIEAVEYVLTGPVVPAQTAILSESLA